MALPDFSMRQLLEAGVHFGHQSHRWNPKMSEYIFGTRNNIHIIDLTLSVPMLHRALQAVSDTVAQGGRILFVGTKRQAQDAIAEAAKRSAQYYVNSRWLGGTLTNWKTVSNSIKRLRTLDEMLVVQRGAGLHQKGTADAAARARQARPRARRHQGHGRASRPRLRHRHQQGRYRDQGGAPSQRAGRRHRRHQLRSGRHHLCRARQRRCQPRHHAVLRSRRQGGDRRHFARARRRKASTSARRPNRWSRKCRRPKINKLGFEPLSGPRGVADDLKKLPGVSPAIEKQLNDLGIFHFQQIAELSPTAAHNVGEEVGLPGRVESWIAKAKELTAEEV